jgi:hypothetical protein
VPTATVLQMRAGDVSTCEGAADHEDDDDGVNDEARRQRTGAIRKEEAQSRPGIPVMGCIRKRRQIERR